MSPTPAPSAQLEADSATLREVFSGFDRLEAMYSHAYERMTPGTRGYFTPDEDNEVRHMLLAYRNYRLACWDIIWRHYLAWRAGGDPANILRGFIVGYAAALRLYQKSLRLIEVAEFDPMLRDKLNEPDRKFDLAEDFFEDVLVSYSSLHNYLRMVVASYYWRVNRRRVRKLGLEEDPTIGWLIPVIVAERRALRGKFWFVLRKRLRRDWRAAWRTLFKPVSVVSYGSRVGIATVLSNVRLALPYVRGIGPGTLERLRATLSVGDVLLMRAEDKITSALLPGFWAHAAIYVGTPADLERLGLSRHPKIARLAPIIARMQSDAGFVVEAVPRGCRIHALDYCLKADHVAVLRPNLTEEELKESLVEAFSHVGKPYDFEFDFNVSSRIVCTELVYRSLHGKGALRFDLTKRLGRYTLTADDVVEQYLKAHGSAGDGAGFTLVDVYLSDGKSEARQVPESDRVTRLADILRDRREALRRASAGG